jgi:hypothetical protein
MSRKVSLPFRAGNGANVRPRAPVTPRQAPITQSTDCSTQVGQFA